MRHVISNARTTIISDGRAMVNSYFTVYMHVFGADAPTNPVPLAGPLSVGRYHDELVLIDGA